MDSSNFFRYLVALGAWGATASEARRAIEAGRLLAALQAFFPNVQPDTSSEAPAPPSVESTAPQGDIAA